MAAWILPEPKKISDTPMAADPTVVKLTHRDASLKSELSSPIQFPESS
jgi:hypothetical protein